MLRPGAAKGKGAAKATGGVRGKSHLPDLVALAPRLPAVAKPKVDAKRKAALNEVAAKPEGKAKTGAKAKTVGDVGVAPDLPVACGLIGGGPLASAVSSAQSCESSTNSRGRASDCKRCSTRFRVASISRPAPSCRFPTCNQRRICTTCRGGCWPSTCRSRVCHHC